MDGSLPVNVSLYHHIMPDSSDGHFIQRDTVTELLRGSATDHTLGIVAAEQQRCDVQNDAVNEFVSQK
jgi:hypothetical protein